MSAAAPRALVAHRVGGSLTWREFRDPVAVLAAHTLDDVPWVLREVERHSSEGRWCVGFVAYEAAGAFDAALTTQPPDAGMPLAWFAVHESAHQAEDPAAAPIPDRQSDVRSDEGSEASHTVSVGPFQLPDAAPYSLALQHIHDEITDGNTYQVNFATRLSARLNGSAEQLFGELVRRQSTEFSAYLDICDHAVLSVSPELFFERRGSHITMRPMKGTVARGETPVQDAANKQWLLASAKNRAENTMIVDLLRNDLGRVARPGSVQVEKLVRLETYPTFHALTSTISAHTTGADLVDLFAALFPCGSITGAPKASTMRIIAGLETDPRGVYCGAIGVVEPGGDARFSVAIRTAVVDSTNRLRYGVGSGVTAESRADEEYAELLTKARIMLTLPGPDLLETFRIQDGTAVHIQRHLGRMHASAVALGYHFDQTAVSEAIGALLAAHPAGTWRARLLLDRGGRFHAEATAFRLDSTVMTARVGPDRVDSGELQLKHKLTDRSPYDSRRIPGVDTTLLVNERDEVTEFLFGNIVVRRGGELLTTPVSCGLLPGVARALALENGRVREHTIRLEDLAGCDEVWHLNSLRGWTPVELRLDRYT